MKRFIICISILALILSVCTFAALEDINEDTCTVVKERVLKGTPVIDGKLDAIYTESMTLKLHGPASSYYISGGSCEDTTATGTVYALYDDNYVYVFYHIVDNTLIQADPEYIEIAAHPHLSDAVEVRIGDDLEDHFAPYDGSNDAHHLIYADAHGVRYSVYEDSMGESFEKAKHATRINDDGKTYYVEMAIPTEKPFKEGEIIQFEFQINDIQDEYDSMCAIGSGYPHHLVTFPIGGASSGQQSSGVTLSVGSASVEYGSENATVKLPVNIKNNLDGILGLALNVTFDETVSAVLVERGTALSGLDYIPGKDISGTSFKLLWDGLDADCSNGTLAYITFEVPADKAGEYSVNITVDSLYDNDMNDISYTAKGGVITVLECDHSYSAKVTAPTCGEKGYTTYTCTVCSDSYVDNETQATGNHSFGGWIVDSYPTQDTMGSRHRTCSICGETETESIDIIDENTAFSSLSSVTAKPGETVKLALTLETTTEVNSIGFSDFIYNSDVLEFVGFADTEDIEDIATFAVFDDDRGIILLAFNEAQVFDNVICSLEFKVSETATDSVQSISFTPVIRKDSTDFKNVTTDSQMNIITYVIGDIDGDEDVDLDDAVYLFGSTMLPKYYPLTYKGNTDFNKDGLVDLRDALLLFNYSMLPDVYPLG